MRLSGTSQSNHPSRHTPLPQLLPTPDRSLFKLVCRQRGELSPHLSRLTCTSGSPSCVSLSSLLYIRVLLKIVSLGSHF